MSPRLLPGLLRKIVVAALAGLLLSLCLTLLWPEVRSRWLLAAAVALGVAMIAAAGALLRSHGRDRDVDLSASELTTLTFPPERHLRSRRR